MGKPALGLYDRFQNKFYQITKKIGKEQYLVPYLMSSHPGCRLTDAIDLALFLKQNKMRPEQVQDFYPTPGTISTCMYYTELDPYTLENVFVPKSPSQKAEQRALLQYFRPENRSIVLKALRDAGRTELIGPGPDCLVNGPAQTKSFKAKNNKDNRINNAKGKKPFKAKGRWDGKK